MLSKLSEMVVRIKVIRINLNPIKLDFSINMIFYFLCNSCAVHINHDHVSITFYTKVYSIFYLNRYQDVWFKIASGEPYTIHNKSML